MTEYEARLEEDNARLHMSLDAAYDELGKYRRAVENALVMVQTAEHSILHRNLKRELLDVLEIAEGGDK